MGFDGLPSYVVDHLQRIATEKGFEEGYDVKHEAGSNPDDGFMAKLVSIKLVGNRRKEPNGDLQMDEFAVVCKIQPTSPVRQRSFGSELVFQREVYMYNVVLPALVEFQKEHRVPDGVAFTCFPKCYASSHVDGNSDSVIILEDLRAAGFEMWDKKRTLDFNTVRLLMEQLGRLHGLSIAFRDQNPKMFRKFQELPKHHVAIFSSPGARSMFQTTYKFAISLMDNAEDVQALERVAKNVVQMYQDGMDEELLGKYSVLSHGDYWINNIMFMMDKGLPKTITLLDWQMARVTSPAIDLTYFFFSTINKALRDAHLDDFLHIYYTSLAGTIRATGSDPEVLFPEAELQRQLRQFGIFGVAFAPLMIPLILADSSEIANLDELAEQMAEGEEGAGCMANLKNDEKIREFGLQMKGVLADARRYGWMS